MGILSELEACKEEVLYRQSKNRPVNLIASQANGQAEGSYGAAVANANAGASSSYVDDETFASLYGVFGVRASTVK